LSFITHVIALIGKEGSDTLLDSGAAVNIFTLKILK